MKKLTALISGLVLATSAKAAVVTYFLSLHESPTGQVTSNNQFSIYAKVSDGDNAGLFAFGIDLKGTGDPGGPTTLTLTNRSPNGTWDADPSDPNNDGGVYTKYAGYGTGRGNSGVTGVVSGVSDLAKGTDLVPVFGIGQQANLRMNDFKPPPAEGSIGPIAYSNYVPATGTDQVLGNPFNPGSAGSCGSGFPFSVPAGAVRLATGSWTGIAPSFEQSSVNTKASVWKLNHPNGTENEIATLQFAVRDVTIVYECFDTVALNGPMKGTNQAVGGAISVGGSNNNYVSEVDQLLDPSMNVGNAPILSIGDEPGAVYVMAKLNGTAADIAGLLSNLQNDVDASDSQFAALHAAYDSQFGGGGFNALFKFPNVAGAKMFNWDFSLGHFAVTVDQLAAVPEPGMALVALGGAAMLLRRRGRRCRA